MVTAPLVQFVVPRYLHGVRIDSFLEKQCRSYTSWRLLRLVAAQLATVNGQVVGVQQRVFAGDLVAVRLVDPPDFLIAAEEIPLSVLFEDQWLLVVNKPPGLIAHPVGDIPTGSLMNAAQHHLDRQSPWPGYQKPGIVHRLDMQTSGAIAICKDHESHRQLSLEFQRERVSKSYVALVHGVPVNSEWTVDRPLGRAPGRHGALMSAAAEAIEPQPSRTLFRVRERFAQAALVEATPRTGRMHQIRVHLAVSGHPLIGDECYGLGGEILPLPDAEGPHPGSPWIKRQALHAERLAFTHPVTRQWLEFIAPWPHDLQTAADRLRAAGG